MADKDTSVVQTEIDPRDREILHLHHELEYIQTAARAGLYELGQGRSPQEMLETIDAWVHELTIPQ